MHLPCHPPVWRDLTHQTASGVCHPPRRHRKQKAARIAKRKEEIRHRKHAARNAPTKLRSTYHLV
eukprot:1247686-Prorocentrum_lima.AAC.1